MLSFNARMCAAANITENAAVVAHDLLKRECPEPKSVSELFAVIIDESRWDGKNETQRQRMYLAGVLMILIQDTCGQKERVEFLPPLTRFVSTVEVQLNICTATLKCFKRHIDERASSRGAEPSKPESATDAG
jgi:hypothetical protein